MDLQTARTICQLTVANAREKSSHTLSERNVQIIQLYCEGKTLQEIGEKFDITREAVRQITVKYSQNLDGSLKEAVDTIKKYRKLEKANKLQQQALLWSHKNPGAPLSQGAIEIGIEISELKKYIKARVKYHPTPTSGKKRASQKKWSDEELLDMIRRCKEETGKITAETFQEWSVSQGGPTKQTPTIRFGTWANAVQQAGVSGTYSVPRKRAYSEEDLWAALVEFCQSTSYAAVVDAYDVWQQETDSRPSTALIRQRLQLSWPDMIATALRISQGNYQGLDPDWVGRVLQPRDWPALVEEARADVNIDELIPAAIEAKGDYLTVAVYDEWALENDKPIGVRLMNSSGKKWAEIVLPFGARIGTRGRRGTMTDDEVLAGLRLYVSENSDLRHDSYKEWARAHRYPSPSLLSKRFGGYTKALKIVQEELGPDSNLSEREK